MAQRQDGVFTWMNSDHLHSATVLADAEGLDIRRLAYAAFGEEAANSGAGAAPTYTYTDKERDRSGLLYYGARYYDPALARFITADSVYDRGPQGLNRYSYALNNPILYRDPTGQYIDDGDGANCYRCIFGSPEKILDGTASIDDGRDGTFNQTVNSYLAGGYATFPTAPGMYASSYSWRGNGLTSGDQFLRDLWHDFDTLNVQNPHYATLYYTENAVATENALPKYTYYALAGVAEIGPHAIGLLGMGLEKFQQMKTTTYYSYSGMAKNRLSAFFTAQTKYPETRVADYSDAGINLFYNIAKRLRAEKFFLATNKWTYCHGKGVIGIGKAYGKGAKFERIAAIRVGNYLGQIPYLATVPTTMNRVKDSMLVTSKGVIVYYGLRAVENYDTLIKAYISAGH